MPLIGVEVGLDPSVVSSAAVTAGAKREAAARLWTLPVVLAAVVKPAVVMQPADVVLIAPAMGAFMSAAEVVLVVGLTSAMITASARMAQAVPTT